MWARVAQGDRKASAHSLVGSRRDGGIAEKVVERVVVQRHRPGKAPQWRDSQESDEEGHQIGEVAREFVDRTQRRSGITTDGQDEDLGCSRRQRSKPEVLNDLPSGGAVVLGKRS